MEREQTILFVDIVGSVELYSRLGDVKATELILGFLAELQEIVEQSGGRVLRSKGDELLCAFDSPMDAARAGCGMQRHTGKRNADEDEKLFIRVGFESGPVLFQNNDVYGDAVNMAARVTAEATRERILVTRKVACVLEPELGPVLRVWTSAAALKNKPDTVELIELCWREMTVPNTNPEPTKKQQQRAVVTFAGRDYELSRGGKPLTLGREDANQIFIPDPTNHVSGSHGQIEFRGGQIELVDTSTNGTYVAFGAESFKLVHRARLALHGAGRMCLGRPPEDPEAIVLEFTIQ